MNRIGTGAITLTDVMDGINPLVFQLSNESHTFVADQDGLISGAEKAVFDCLTDVYVGESKSQFVEVATTLIDESNKLDNIGKYNVVVTSSDAGWTPALVTDGMSGKITLDVVPTGTVNKSVKLTVAYTAVNSVGNIVTSERIISIVKGIQGVDGVAVRLEADHNYFLAGSDGVITVSDDKVTIRVKTVGDVGTLTAGIMKDGGVEAAVTFTQADDDEDGYNDTNIVLWGTEASSDAAGNGDPFFGDSDRVTIVVKGSAASTASDVITIARIKSGHKGEAAVTVFVSSDTQGTIFKNGAADTHKKTLTAKAYDMETGTEITANLTYIWRTGGVVVVTDTGDNVVPTGTADSINAEKAFIIIGSEDVPDGESSEFTCDVTITA